MKFLKQIAKNQYGYETKEITKEEAIKYISNETINHLYNDLVIMCGANTAYEEIGAGIYIGVSR